MRLQNIKNLIQEDLAAVEDEIAGALVSEVPQIQQISLHLHQNGGKRIRPIVCILAARCINPDISRITLSRAAAIVELIHTATLLHDDVIDNSSLRRNVATANAKWDNSPAVLVGDFLYAQAFSLMIKIGNMQLMNIISEATKKLAEGEMLQLQQKFNLDLPETEYLKIITNKTAVLFNAAAQIGALIALGNDSDQAAAQSLQLYTNHLGLAFQLVDDLLDYKIESKSLDKNAGDDWADGKITLPLIHCLNNHKDPELKSKIGSLYKISPMDQLATFEQIIEFCNSTDSFNYAAKHARLNSEKAIQALNYLPNNNYNKALMELARHTVEREF